MPFRRAAQEMRDLYANRIALAVSRGETPTRHDIESWMRYDAASRATDPFDELMGHDEES